MAGWFELSKSSDNQFRFVLKAGNGETILTSELYTSKASAEKGIASVRSNSPQEERYEKKTASNGKFYFNLKAANHQIIGSSQMYATAQSRETGIASVKANGTSQTVKDNNYDAGRVLLASGALPTPPYSATMPALKVGALP